jgi:hypothetical protein
MSGNGDSAKIKAFIIKVGQINFSSINGHWGNVQSFWKLRNRIVHHGSKVERDDKDQILKHQEQLLKKYKSSLKLRHDEFSFTDVAILEDYMKAIEKLMISLYKLLQKRSTSITPKSKKKSTAADLFKRKKTTK